MANRSRAALQTDHSRERSRSAHPEHILRPNRIAGPTTSTSGWRSSSKLSSRSHYEVNRFVPLPSISVANPTPHGIIKVIIRLRNHKTKSNFNFQCPSFLMKQRSNSAQFSAKSKQIQTPFHAMQHSEGEPDGLRAVYGCDSIV
jgi:hypothetical protein